VPERLEVAPALDEPAGHRDIGDVAAIYLLTRVSADTFV
jgi:hypothetical protein